MILDISFQPLNMRRKTRRSKQGDSLAQKLDFNGSSDEVDVSTSLHESTGGGEVIPTSKTNNQARCPLCSCTGHNQGIPTDCNCSSCLSIYAAESDELRDDFCHRDRPRFAFWCGERTKNTFAEPVKTTTWLLKTFVLLLIILIAIILLLCIKWILIDGFGNLMYLWLNLEGK